MLVLKKWGKNIHKGEKIKLFFLNINCLFEPGEKNHSSLERESQSQHTNRQSVREKTETEVRRARRAHTETSGCLISVGATRAHQQQKQKQRQSTHTQWNFHSLGRSVGRANNILTQH